MKGFQDIGILGGTFDPIHKGHLAIAKEILKKVDLDRILLIPSGCPPHKNAGGILVSSHRLAMVRLAVQGQDGLEVSDLEVRRRGKSYTIETLKTLKKIHPRGTEFYLILGLDAFLDFCSWREHGKIRSLCHIIVVSRPGSRFSNLPQLGFLKSINPVPLKALDRGRRSCYRYPLSPRKELILIKVRARYDLSATRIRALLKGGKGLRNRLPKQVESYIIKRNLYKW